MILFFFFKIFKFFSPTKKRFSFFFFSFFTNICMLLKNIEKKNKKKITQLIFFIFFQFFLAKTEVWRKKNIFILIYFIYLKKKYDFLASIFKFCSSNIHHFRQFFLSKFTQIQKIGMKSWVWAERTTPEHSTITLSLLYIL